MLTIPMIITGALKSKNPKKKNSNGKKEQLHNNRDL